MTSQENETAEGLLRLRDSSTRPRDQAAGETRVDGSETDSLSTRQGGRRRISDVMIEAL